jgi:hypothetical protein
MDDKETYRIVIPFTPGSYLIDPTVAWLRRYGATVTISDDASTVIATFATQEAHAIATGILVTSPDRFFQEITYGENISLVEVLQRAIRTDS